MITRFARTSIEEWITDKRDALLVTGARQIGKTYLIRQCLKDSEYPYLELNFIERPELVELFSSAKNTDELLMRLTLLSDKPLEKGRTIIFLDEIQEYNEIVTMIKFLVDDGSYRYIMSGSLLGVELNDLRSAPVGYMEVLDMYPMNFHEFSSAVGIPDSILDALQTHFDQRTPVDSYVHARMLDVFYLYLIVGGMPEAVDVYLQTSDLARVAQIHDKIIRMYRADCSKYEKKYRLRLREIYDAMPGQLNQENKRFRINTLGTGVNYDRVANDFLWLKDAGIAIPVYNISEPKLPLLISENRNLFKLFFSDVGLLTSRYSNQVRMAILNKASSINNGALFENVVAQELLSKELALYYFNSKKQGELDFVIELDGKVVPLEVKSGKSYKRHSALNNVLGNDDYHIDHAYILSEGNVEVTENGRRIYIPIYMMMFLQEYVPEQTIYQLDLLGLQ